MCLGGLLDGRDLLAGGCVLQGAEDHVLSVGDETYRVVSWLCAMMGDIRRVSSSHVFMHGMCDLRPPLWSSGQSFWLQIQRSRVRFPALPDFMSSSGSGTGSTQPREVN